MWMLLLLARTQARAEFHPRDAGCVQAQLWGIAWVLPVQDAGSCQGDPVAAQPRHSVLSSSLMSRKFAALPPKAPLGGQIL